ncbi:RidA family protein [Neptunomonas japonica]|uniref:Endoribonuclease L-PSP n=1 Tax=Neptunomonas japonica JAMM 1380 TaxID=1441457 RepID=A0A7R6PBP6_9GAMM|nr:RidA family protein [Neptunomonas japonica]BBB29544.1 endoribonuclease L-PSP [Neptunomonas japonica JAMM 1380]
MINRYNKNERMSQAVEYNGTIILAGQLATDTSVDIKGQTQEILSRVDDLLAQAGTNKSRLLSATIWVSDMNDFAAMNDVWVGWIDAENPPVRACVRADLITPDYKVEIQVTAVK